MPARLRDAARYTHYTLSDPDLSAADARQMRAEAHAFLARSGPRAPTRPRRAAPTAAEPSRGRSGSVRGTSGRDGERDGRRASRGDGGARAHQLREDEKDEEDVTAAAVWPSEEAGCRPPEAGEEAALPRARRRR